MIERDDKQIEETKVVALVDWNWIGHHPAYFVQFAIAIARNGCRVLPICPAPGDFIARVEKESVGAVSPEVRARILQPLGLSHPQLSRLRPARFRGVHDAFRRFGALGSDLRKWQRATGNHIDLVFFACIFDHVFLNFTKVRRFFRFAWSGLYLQSRSFRMPGSPMPFTGVVPRPERIFTSRLMRSIATLDEGTIGKLSSLTGDKPVVLFPDLTHTTVPSIDDDHSALARRILKFSAGRPVVSLVGHLQWTKGLEDFVLVANHESMRGMVFILCGEVNWAGIPRERRSAIESLLESCENIFTHLCSISDEAINAVMSASDVIYAGYRSFPNSSNILTKCAVVEKPVLVSDGYLMAERVRRYRMGEIVPEGDHSAILETLTRMTIPGYGSKLAMSARWADCRNDHCVTRLESAFARILFCGNESHEPVRPGALNS